MNVNGYASAIRLSTMAAMKAGVSIPEVLGVLEITKHNVLSNAERAALDQKKGQIVRVDPIIPPGLSPPAGN